MPHSHEELDHSLRSGSDAVSQGENERGVGALAGQVHRVTPLRHARRACPELVVRGIAVRSDRQTGIHLCGFVPACHGGAIREVVVTVQGPEAQATVEVFWEGGARSEPVVRLNRRGPERRRTAEDTIELVRRLALHHPDAQIAAILNKQGRHTGTGLAFTEARVRGIRQRAGIPAVPPPDGDGETVTIQHAARELGVSSATIRRWLNDGLLPAEQTTRHAPWRIRLTDEVRRQFVPDVPDGFVALDDAARLLGCARQTVLHKVQRGELRAIHVTRGRRSGLRIEVPAARVDRLINQ